METISSKQRRLPGSSKSSNGCWTCKLRKKKCDENVPQCHICTSLHITCFYQEGKPDWMDNGLKQETMAARFKREVRQNAHLRLRDTTRDNIESSGEILPTSFTLINQLATDAVPSADLLIEAQERMQSKFSQDVKVNRTDSVLIMFYIEHIFGFLFPFYDPPMLEGGKAWILEMMIKSPVVRHATLCQSAYFFSLVRGIGDQKAAWQELNKRTADAFSMLRGALQVVVSSSLCQHIAGGVRILSSIMQLQRFEIAVSSFANCKAHLDAAMALFRHFFAVYEGEVTVDPTTRFNAILKQLDTENTLSPTLCFNVQSAEQAAFHFSITLLLFDDIIASTVLQEPPKLYDFHSDLLIGRDDKPLINLETAVGCQNWVLSQIGVISALDAWREQCHMNGNLDMMQLVQRATLVQNTLASRLSQVESPAAVMTERKDLLELLNTDMTSYPHGKDSRTNTVTRIWALSALIYLDVVVSGWQPANTTIHAHVNSIVELIMHHLPTPALVRTIVWPLCVAGCLADPAQETQIRTIIASLQPSSVFGTVRKALSIMEDVWSARGTVHASHNLAKCFQSQGNLVLLV